MSKLDKKPEIRFREFTDEWVQTQFGDIATTTRGLTYSPSDISKDGVRVLRSSNIDEDTFILSEDDIFVNPACINIDTVNENDILITSANGSNRLVGKHAIIRNIKGEAVHGGFMLLAKSDDAEFINASMSSNWYKKFINLYVAGGNGAIGNLNKSDLDAQDIYIPIDKQEKAKIGEFYKHLDDIINIHERKYDKLVNIKKAMVEKMFPDNGEKVPEIRFKEFTNDWEEHKLEELGDIVTGSTPSTQNPSYYAEEGIPWVTPTDISENIIYNTEKRLSLKGQQVARVVPKNTILVTSIASIGKNTMLGTTGSFNQQINGLIPNEEEYEPYFLFTESTCWSNKMKKIAGTGTLQIVNKTEFSELQTTVPSLAEQRKIGQLFKNIDDLITLHQRKIEKLRNIKSSCLNKMFI